MAKLQLLMRPTAEQTKKAKQELQLSLDNFNKWVAAKSQLTAPQPENRKIIQLRPNPVLTKLNQLSPKPVSLGFFNPALKPKPLFNSLKPSPSLDSLKNQQKNDKEKENLPTLNMACNNCGEVGHNSMSCSKLNKSPKR